MKKTLKIVLISLGAIAVILLAFFAYMFLPIGVTRVITPTGRIADNVYTISGGSVNCYLVPSGADYILIDTLAGPEALKAGLDELGIDPESIRTVFLTHSDYDHSGGLPLLPNAAVYMSADEEQMIDGKTARFIFAPPSVKEIRHTALNDNQNLLIGNTMIRAIAVPGHTPGSMCYLIDGKYLFAGDSMNLNDGKVDVFFFKYTMDMETLKKSIRKVAAITGISAIFTGHTGYTTNAQAAFEGWK
ncbi:MAG: MBL fold metallo-hydrolase [Brevinematales bacterium]|nr:MBL fold metallo-hydrolase [Brevinematales bacterium]